MGQKRHWAKSILELAEHAEFISHWVAEIAKFAVGPTIMGLIAAIWAAVKGWDSLWIGIAAIAAFAAALLLVAGFIFLINQARKLRLKTAQRGGISTVNSVQLSQQCLALVQEIREFIYERKVAEPSFWPETEMQLADSEEQHRRFKERADYSNKTRDLFLFKFNAKLVALDEALRQQGRAPHVDWLWHPENDPQGIIETLIRCSQRVDIPVTPKPALRLALLGRNIFIPDAPDVCDRLTGIALNARIWNIGAPSVATEWHLLVIPKVERLLLRN